MMCRDLALEPDGIGQPIGAYEQTDVYGNDQIKILSANNVSHFWSILFLSSIWFF
jgi:hypothetical protein